MSRCECWRCQASRALRSLTLAINNAIEEGAETEMHDAWLANEFEDLAARPWWRLGLRAEVRRMAGAIANDRERARSRSAVGRSDEGGEA